MGVSAPLRLTLHSMLPRMRRTRNYVRWVALGVSAGVSAPLRRVLCLFLVLFFYSLLSGVGFYAVALTLFFILLSSCDSGLCCFVGSIIPGGVLGVSAPLRRNYVRWVALEVGSTELRSMGCAGGSAPLRRMYWGFRPPTTDAPSSLINTCAVSFLFLFLFLFLSRATCDSCLCVCLTKIDLI